MKQLILITAALFAGLFGGVLGARLTGGEHLVTDVRARSFELMDEAGQVISIWAVDKKGHAVLAFRDTNKGRDLADNGARPAGLDNPVNQGAAIGMAGDSPFLTFRAPDGTTRMQLYLSDWQKPLLMMEDETGPRMALGINQSDTPNVEDNDWALSFMPDRAWIGMFTRAEGGQKYVRGFLSISKDKVKSPSVQRR